MLGEDMFVRIAVIIIMAVIIAFVFLVSHLIKKTTELRKNKQSIVKEIRKNVHFQWWSTSGQQSKQDEEKGEGKPNERE